MANTHEHLEHAEHATHHAGDAFNRRVAVTMAIVAAALAGISMLGHRKHNEVLQLQGESNRLQTEANIIETKANIDHTHATDQWGFYQAKNAREHMYTADIGLLDALAPNPEKAADAAAFKARMQGQVAKYQKELPELMAKAKELTAAGDKKMAEAVRKQGESAARLADSHHAHRQADRLDYAHLAAEIGLVVCSIALLTKRKVYWLAGIAAALVAVGTAASAYFIPHHPHESHAHGPAGQPPSDGGSHTH